VPKRQVGAALNRYRLARALRGEPTADDVEADRLIEEVTRAAADLTIIVGSVVAADVLEKFASLLRHAKMQSAWHQVATNSGLLGNFKTPRPRHRQKGSIERRTGYERGEEFLDLFRRGWNKSEIARYAKDTSDDPLDANVPPDTFRMRINSVLKYQQATEDTVRKTAEEAVKREKQAVEQSTGLAAAGGLLGLHAAMKGEKEVG
jgi:hypothetical protein